MPSKVLHTLLFLVFLIVLMVLAWSEMKPFEFAVCAALIGYSLRKLENDVRDPID